MSLLLRVKARALAAARAVSIGAAALAASAGIWSGPVAGEDYLIAGVPSTTPAATMQPVTRDPWADVRHAAIEPPCGACGGPQVADSHALALVCIWGCS